MSFLNLVLVSQILTPTSSAYENELFRHSKEAVVGTDLSASYENLFQTAECPLSESDIGLLRQTKFLIVPGFLSDVGSSFRSQLSKIAPWLFHKTEGQIDWLEQEKIPFEKLDIESEGSSEHNAAIITKAIRASEHPVILISHSKGGLDILEALLSNADLRSKVRGWIPIQAPFFGTPVSDVWTENPNYRSAAEKILERLGGSVDSLLGMRMKDRLPYMQAHEAEVSDLLLSIPTITFGGFAKDITGRWDTVFEPYFRDQMADAKIESDGVVPWRNTVLRGNDFVLGKGVDHMMPIGAINLTPFDRVKFLQAMLKLLVLKIARVPTYQ